MLSANWTARAWEELEKLEVPVARRILKKIDELIQDPYSRDIKRLKGESAFRLRVGDYRVIFEISGNTILILKVGHRRNIYER